MQGAAQELHNVVEKQVKQTIVTIWIQAELLKDLTFVDLDIHLEF